MSRAHLRTLVPILLATACLLTAGCVASTRYKMAKPGGQPAEVLGFRAVAPEVSATVQHVIVFRGPGSWKREARWDEYVLRLENPTDHPVVIREVALDDFEEHVHLPGVDPWELEKMSYTEWERLKRNGVRVAAGAGAVLGYTALLGGALAGSTAAATAAGLIPIVGIVDVTAVAVINHKNKKAVVAEFSRRRLTLPLTLAPGEVREGSLFFTMTPGPQRLRFCLGQNPSDEWFGFPLPQLAKLHFAPDANAAKH
jgi:hypothetical protein